MVGKTDQTRTHLASTCMPSVRAWNEMENARNAHRFPIPPTFTPMPLPHHVENPFITLKLRVQMEIISGDIPLLTLSPHPTFRATFDHYSHNQQ
eukprot:3350267-Amphidinium_carterae.1